MFDKKGVSPVVGTILLIAITVALAAVVATLVSGLGGRGAPPSAMFTVKADSSGNNVVLTISHEGGDDLNISDLQVQASDTSGKMRTATLSPSSGTLSVGGKLTATCSYGGSAGGNVITVYVINNPSKQKLYSSSSIVVEAASQHVYNLYCHQETTTIAGKSYYLLKGAPADNSGTTFDDPDGYNVLGAFVYPLTNVITINASTLTVAYYGNAADEGHYSVDILIRKSDGSIRATLASDVAGGGGLNDWGTTTGTYAFSSYTVVSSTDYLEIDYGYWSPGDEVWLTIDNNSLPLADQTRSENWSFSSV